MPTIEVSDETYSKIKDQLTEDEKLDLDELDDMVGKKWFIRTVTYHWTGRVKKRVGKFFVLEKAACIFDSGRFMQAIKNGTLNEVEPVGDAVVSIPSVVDMIPWKHKLPTEQK
jgi:hypothetical protein